ncbi:UNVERIFIED_CONTAM: hypothetical protein HDU68_005688 [Siphonaria sp. JEL0065]|nr:hypothetical protein HDU68_005688 [Siphonaria sp. JEL0065]
MLTAIKELLDTVPDPYILATFNIESNGKILYQLWPSKACCKIINIPTSSISHDQRAKVFYSALPIVMEESELDCFKDWVATADFPSSTSNGDRASGSSIQMAPQHVFHGNLRKGVMDGAAVGAVCDIEWSGRVLDDYPLPKRVDPTVSFILLRLRIVKELVHSSFLTENELSTLNTTKDPTAKSENMKARGMQKMIELAPCSLVLYDIQGKAIHVNNRFYEFIGLAEHDWGIDKIPPFSNFVHPDGFQKFAESRLHAMKTLTQVYTEIRMISGPCTHLWISYQPLIDKSTNTLLGFMGCGIDISERKCLEAERLEAVQELARMEHTRAQEAEENRLQQEMFIDMVCHEIRNPLNGIMHCNQFIKSRLQTIRKCMGKLEKRMNEADEKAIKGMQEEVDRGLEECESIQLCATHQKAIADDVLHLSKMKLSLFYCLFLLSCKSGLLSKILHSMKMMKLDLANFHVKSTITQVIESFRAQLQLKQITYEIIFSDLLQETPNLGLIGDRVRITQIIINIFTNAIKFVQNVDVKRIRVLTSVFERDEYAESGRVGIKVSIEDSGIGMTEEERLNLFQKFKQASQKTHTQYGGTGLGLYISKSLVEQMEGFFEVDSTKGKGTTFSFTIPLSRGLISATPSSSPEPVAKSIDSLASQSQKDETPPILVVDDNDINRKILTSILKKAGYECKEAVNGFKAFEFVSVETFLLVFMDVEMPVMDGTEATYKIREFEASTNRDKTIIVGVTGNARSEQVQALIDAGMQDVVVKPFKQKDIINCVEKILKSRSFELEK